LLLAVLDLAKIILGEVVMRSSISVLIAFLVCFLVWTQVPAGGESADNPVLPLGVVTGTADTATPTVTPMAPTATSTVGAATATNTAAATATVTQVRTPTSGTPSTRTATAPRPTNTPGEIIVIEDDGCQVVQARGGAWPVVLMALALIGLRRRTRR
jgi:MYXO-CTERM domain-containing protein